MKKNKTNTKNDVHVFKMACAIRDSVNDFIENVPEDKSCKEFFEITTLALMSNLGSLLVKTSIDNKIDIRALIGYSICALESLIKQYQEDNEKMSKLN